MTADLDSQTDVLRRFSRAYTARIGVLEDSFLGRGRPLATSRLLFEIGSCGEAGVGLAELRARLDLDSGYLSRLLGQLEAEGLVTVTPDRADRRRRVAALTDDGRAEWQELEERSQARARALVEPLSPRHRARLVEALGTADLLVRAATVRLERRRPDDPQVLAAVEQYVAELDRRFPDGFRAGAGEAVDPGGHYLLAISDGEPVAVGGVRPLPDASPAGVPTAEVKRMWVDPAWRGSGLGARVLAALEDLARELGHRRVLLDTHRTLGEAVAMYVRAGYLEVERYNDNPYAQAFFEKRL